MTQVPLPFMPVLSCATLSSCGTYRYTLSRSLDHQSVYDPDVEGSKSRRRRCLFVMLNPSTADALVNDPTIEKCVKLARAWGHQRLDVGNLYAYRATDPKALRRSAGIADLGMGIIGPKNDDWLRNMASLADTIVLGWGNNSPLPERALDVVRLLQRCRTEPPALWCLKQNKDGSPIHPLYQRDDSQLVEYSI